MSADARLLDALRALADVLGRLDRPGMVIGGIAVIARGVPRQTADIDAAVWAEGLDLRDLLTALAGGGIIPRIEDAETFAAKHQVLLLRHGASDIPLEVSLAWLPFEWEALKRAELVDFGGVRIPVATAEDLVVYKAVAWRDRDRADIGRLLARHHRAIDLDRVRSLVKQFADALEEPARVADFEQVIQEAIGDR